MSDRINTLARALVFACMSYDADSSVSVLASDNPIHGQQWSYQKLARDTTRMLHSFCKQYAKQWAKAEVGDTEIDWNEVGMVLAGTGCGYDGNKGQESLREVCQRICRAVWPSYEHNAMWRLNRQGTLTLDCTYRPKLLFA